MRHVNISKIAQARYVSKLRHGADEREAREVLKGAVHAGVLAGETPAGRKVWLGDGFALVVVESDEALKVCTAFRAKWFGETLAKQIDDHMDAVDRASIRRKNHQTAMVEAARRRMAAAEHDLVRAAFAAPGAATEPHPAAIRK